ncbi:MAG: ELKS/Rab6-interacting/CAST family protein [Spirochaetaceae bacterium]
MVDDKQIVLNDKNLTHNATTLFIHEESEHNIPPKLYDLDLEFSNTKKNKNRVTVVSLILFTLIFIAAAYFVTRYIENQNSQVPISIDAFEDVNLREIFDKAKQYNKEMKDARRELKDLITQKEAGILDLEDRASGQTQIINTENPINKASKINSIKDSLEIDIKNHTESYDKAILQLENRIISIQDNIDSYDTRIVKKAQEQEELINNQQKRFDMEMEKSVDYYEGKIKDLENTHKLQVENIVLNNTELIKTINKNNDIYAKSLEDKYNPKLFQDYLTNVTLNNINIDTLRSNNIGDTIYDEGLLNRDKVDIQLQKVINAKETFNNLKDIPYYNYPKQAINYLENVYQGTVGDYTDLIKMVGPKINFKNSVIRSKTYEIDQMDYFLTNYVKTSRVNGVIIDPRNSAIKVFMDPIYNIKEDTTGLVFRNDSDYIGMIQFKYRNGVLIARVLQLSDENRGINPFDKILINLK